METSHHDPRINLVAVMLEEGYSGVEMSNSEQKEKV